MLVHRAVRRATLVGVVALVTSVAPVLAEFGPSVVAVQGDTGQKVVVTDLASRGDRVALSLHVVVDAGPRQALAWSTDPDVPLWPVDIDGDRTSRQSQVTVCADHAAMVYTATDDEGASWVITTFAAPYDGGSGATRDWTTSGVARYPDIACVADHELVAAWFEREGSDWGVRVRTREPQSAGSSPQSFGLGRGTPSRGLAVASSSNRVYVAWFRGQSLKLRRFAIGSAPNHTLTSLGTSTIASLPYGNTPELGADGDRVILAFMDRADLKVRRSTDRGASFGSPRTLRNEPFPSEIGAFPTTVAVKGSRVAIGAVELGGLEELVGRGLGYKSTNGGASYSQVSSHASGRVVATLVRPGSAYRYAEVWDESISDPSAPRIRFRRE